MLVVVVAITLTFAFWIVIGIEGKNLKNQVLNDAETITDIFKMDIERILNHIRKQEVHLQETIDQISETQGVKYVNVNDVENKYIATTDHALVGQKIKQNDLAVIAEIKKRRANIDVRNERADYYELLRYIPIFINEGDPKSNIINIIAVDVVTRSKGVSDVRESEKLLQAVTSRIEQDVRPIVLTYKENFVSLQQITDIATNLHFFRNFIIYNNRLEIIAKTRDDSYEFKNGSQKYKQIRENTLAGKYPSFQTEHSYNNVPIIVKVAPITSRDKNTGAVKNIGLVEIHILGEAYKTRVNELTARMIGVGTIFTIVLVIVLAIILEHEVVGPIRRYSITARKIADGDLTQIVERTSNDEIGQFGDVFNSMVINIKELDNLKSDFISVAVRQLRTPLFSVRSVLQLFLDGDMGVISKDQKGMLKRGYDTNEKIIQLVNDLLNVSRIENENFGYKIEKNDFNKLLNMLIENTVLHSKDRNIEVKFDNGVGQIPEFTFDSEKLLIALQNVVDNAMKYTFPGGKVTIVVSRRGDYIEVKIADTGVGVPKAEIPKLFSKFFRATNIINLQTEGSGLGLFISKNIIARHGGQVWADSVEGKGSTFTVLIPVIAELIPKPDSVVEVG